MLYLFLKIIINKCRPSSFTVEVWVFWEGSLPTSSLPILSSVDSQINLRIKDRHLAAQIGSQPTEGSTVLVAGQWYHLAVIYEAQSEWRDSRPSVNDNNGGIQTDSYANLFIIQLLHLITQQ